MPDDNKYKNYSSTDIEKYHKGLLSPKEMNELEKAALDDPFLADALEGYGNTRVNVSADMQELEMKLEQRISGAKVVPIAPRFSLTRLLKVAAIVFFVAGSAFFIYKMADRSNDSMAIREKSPAPQSTVTPDTNKQTPVVINNNAVQRESKIADSKTEKKPASIDTVIGVISDKVIHPADGMVSMNKPDTLKIKNSNNFSAESKPVLYDDAVESVNNQSKKNKEETRDFKQTQPSSVSRSAELSDQEFKKSAVGLDKNLATNYFRGRVLDNNNNALPFANISNVKDNVGTYADAQGNFTLISPDSVLDVRVKSIGFVTDTIQLQRVSSYNKVVLNEEHSMGLVLGGKRQAKIPSPEENIKAEESEPEDGWSNYNLYVANNIKIPDGINEKDIQRQEVKLSFEVNKLGEPIDIKVEKSNCKVCDEEAIRLVKDGPKWKPKKKKSRVTLTIPF